MIKDIHFCNDLTWELLHSYSKYSWYSWLHSYSKTTYLLLQADWYLYLLTSLFAPKSVVNDFARTVHYNNNSRCFNVNCTAAQHSLRNSYSYIKFTIHIKKNGSHPTMHPSGFLAYFISYDDLSNDVYQFPTAPEGITVIGVYILWKEVPYVSMKIAPCYTIFFYRNYWILCLCII